MKSIIKKQFFKKSLTTFFKSSGEKSTNVLTTRCLPGFLVVTATPDPKVVVSSAKKNELGF